MRVAWGWLKAAGVAVLQVLAAPACGTAENRDPVASVPAAHVLDSYRAEFDLRWRGHLAGRAREELSARPGASGYRLARSESWRVARGDSVVEWEIEVVIDADSRLRGERIAFYRDRRLRGSARRVAGGWIIETPDQPPRRAPPAEPAELVLLRAARPGAAGWSGPVLLAGFDFAAAELAVEPVAARELRAVLTAPAGRLQTRVWLRGDGTVERAAGPDVTATRSVEGAPAGQPPDLIALGAISVAGSRRAAIEIDLAPRRDPPAALPGQRILAAPAGWRVELDGSHARIAWPVPAIADPAPAAALRALADRVVNAAGAAGPLEELRALARHTADDIGDDVSAGTVSAAGDVLLAGRADCVGHAALFSALARARGFDVRLVSGYRLDGRVLARHMWAVARVGTSSIVVDPTAGEAPAAPGHHIGLAAHGSAPAEIALAAELAFAGLSGARARFVK